MTDLHNAAFNRAEVMELCRAAKAMRDAANALWWANNPDEDMDGQPPDPDDAQEDHSAAFSRLRKAEYHVLKRLGEDASNL